MYFTFEQLFGASNCVSYTNWKLVRSHQLNVMCRQKKPRAPYSVSVLRYRGSKMKNTRKLRSFQNVAEDPAQLFSENMVFISVLGFEKFASQV